MSNSEARAHVAEKPIMHEYLRSVAAGPVNLDVLVSRLLLEEAPFGVCLAHHIVSNRLDSSHFFHTVYWLSACDQMLGRTVMLSHGSIAEGSIMGWQTTMDHVIHSAWIQACFLDEALRGLNRHRRSESIKQSLRPYLFQN
eukprot:66193-Amphidinium_carterae.1